MNIHKRIDIRDEANKKLQTEANFYQFNYITLKRALLQNVLFKKFREMSYITKIVSWKKLNKLNI